MQYQSEKIRHLLGYILAVIFMGLVLLPAMAQAKAKVKRGEAYYLKLKDFVTNIVLYEDEEGFGLIRLTLEVKADTEDELGVITHHMPKIRNNFLNIIREYSRSELQRGEGQKQLHIKLRNEIRRIMNREEKDYVPNSDPTRPPGDFSNLNVLIQRLVVE